MTEQQKSVKEQLEALLKAEAVGKAEDLQERICRDIIQHGVAEKIGTHIYTFGSGSSFHAVVIIENSKGETVTSVSDVTGWEKFFTIILDLTSPSEDEIAAMQRAYDNSK